jgi:sec-independent protein translocase protein TatA
MAKGVFMSFLRDFGLPELLIILVIIVILFGPGRIGKVAGELGKGIRSFRDNLAGKGDEKKEDKNEDGDKPEPPNIEPK